MADVLKGPVPEDLLAVTGRSCGARLTRLAEIEDGIDFRPDAAAQSAFEVLQKQAAANPSGAAPPVDADMKHR